MGTPSGLPAAALLLVARCGMYFPLGAGAPYCSTCIPTAPAPLHFTFTSTCFCILSNHSISCNHDRQPRFGSNSDSRHKRSTLEKNSVLRALICANGVAERLQPQKEAPVARPDVTDPPRSCSLARHPMQCARGCSSCFSQARPTVGASTGAQRIRIGTPPFRLSPSTAAMSRPLALARASKQATPTCHSTCVVCISFTGF
jgi:hypothetical protein